MVWKALGATSQQIDAALEAAVERMHPVVFSDYERLLGAVDERHIDVTEEFARARSRVLLHKSIEFGVGYAV
jgi:hypothetical protein